MVVICGGPEFTPRPLFGRYLYRGPQRQLTLVRHLVARTTTAGHVQAVSPSIILLYPWSIVTFLFILCTSAHGHRGMASMAASTYPLWSHRALLFFDSSPKSADAMLHCVPSAIAATLFLVFANRYLHQPVRVHSSPLLRTKLVR